jgi:hypothetical protein
MLGTQSSEFPHKSKQQILIQGAGEVKVFSTSISTASNMSSIFLTVDTSLKNIIFLNLSVRPHLLLDLNPDINIE